MASTPNVHDSFLRSLLADKQMAIDYFRSALPAHIADKLDFNTLSPLAGTYVSKELQTTIADVVYTCQRRDGRGSVHICLLVEHKSAPDKYTPVQIGGYIFSGYGQQIKQKRKRLSPIIPVLFYHGRQKWEYWTLDRLFGGLDEEMLGFLPNFAYVYNDVSGMSDREVTALGNAFLGASLLTLKHAFDVTWLNVNFARVMSIALSGRYGGLGPELVTYYLRRAELSPEDVREIIKKLPQTIRRKVMSTYELLKAEGFELGIEKGKTEFVTNLVLNTDFEDAKIASLAIVDLAFVKKVRADLAKKK